ncbi:MAG: hypothetical protein WC209_10630 [Ignavibacteriaceae bacterium]|jgi:hypothetical protein
MKLLNKNKSNILLAAYLFIVVTGSFHFHSYSYNLSGDFSLATPVQSNSGTDFSDNASGDCSVEHFFQSLNVDTNYSISYSIILPESNPFCISSSFGSTHKTFYYSFPLRAPPVI